MSCPQPVHRLRLELSYDGTDFVGSQRQPGVRTVQGELERALDRLKARSGPTVFAGRTDRGVHARGQVVSVDVIWRSSADELADALNASLASDIGVIRAAFVDDRFHARFDAQWREYRYSVVEAPAPPILERRYAWWRRDRLDAEAAADAARRLEGDHVFGSFASNSRSTREPDEKLRRRVFVCRWRRLPVSASEWPVVGRHELRVVASGFLPHMVRNITGALICVGRGLQSPEWIQSVLGANDRNAVGAPAPPEGLTLWRVGYDRFDACVGREPAIADVSLGV